jgi:UDP-N-acetylmuramate--alanine ligase
MKNRRRLLLIRPNDYENTNDLLQAFGEVKKKVENKVMFKNIKKLHFVGIGGIGMSSIAEILLNQGFIISGSDRSLSEITRRDSAVLGMTIYEGHSSENLKDADVLVYSSAVTPDNPEVMAAVLKERYLLLREAKCLPK